MFSIIDASAAFGQQQDLSFSLFDRTVAEKLSKAVQTEDTAAINLFVKQNQTLINFQEPKYGYSLLGMAIFSGLSKSVNMLLSLGANPNLKTVNGSSTFLEFCIQNRNIKNSDSVLIRLINNGANINASIKDVSVNSSQRRFDESATALRLLCIYGNLHLVKILVDRGAKTTGYGPNSHAILSTAALSGKLDIVEYLLIEKRCPVPGYVAIRKLGPNNIKRLTLIDVVNQNMGVNTQDQILKEKIISFLKKHKS